jgi:hypothetical protein
MAKLEPVAPVVVDGLKTSALRDTTGDVGLAGDDFDRTAAVALPLDA